MSEGPSSDFKVRREKAADADTSVAELADLAADPHTGVRTSVAENASTPPETLKLLSRDSSEWVRAAVAVNPRTGQDVALDLARDSAWYVRAQVGEHVRLDAETALLLGQDAQIDVIRAVAQNHHFPLEAVSVIRNCGDEEALGNLATNPKLDDDGVLDLLPKISSWKRMQIAERSTLSPALQEVLSKDEDSTVRAKLSENINVNPQLLRTLANDSDQDVRTAVHRNPSSDDDTKAMAVLLGVEKKVSLRD